MEALPQRSAQRTPQLLSPADAVDTGVVAPVEASTLLRTAYYGTAAVSGFCMMGLEILAGPMLEPHFGSSNDVWTGIITVFLVALSVGYSIGGRLADRAPASLALGLALVSGGLLYCLMPVYGFDLISFLVATIPQTRMGALFASMGLFFVPSVALGMVSPMLVKLVFQGIDELGRTTGTVYTVAAVGNVLGVMATNYLLLDVIGLSATLYAMGLVLLAIGALHLLRRGGAGPATDG